MVTMTFRNLSQSKKDRILDAAKKEFSRVPLEKALISNIIRDAQIPRGSFYQYFDTLDDLFLALLESIYGNLHKKLSEYLAETNGNYFEAVKLKFKDVIDYFDNDENKQYNLNLHSIIVNKIDDDEFFNVVLKIKKKEELKYVPTEYKDSPFIGEVVGLIAMVNYSQLNILVIGDRPKEKVYQEYCDYLDYIKTTIEAASK